MFYKIVSQQSSKLSFRKHFKTLTVYDIFEIKVFENKI